MVLVTVLSAANSSMACIDDPVMNHLFEEWFITNDVKCFISKCLCMIIKIKFIVI